nr:immunoglobulin light chain junction region [Macaca mulatta]
CQQYKDLVTF